MLDFEFRLNSMSEMPTSQTHMTHSTRTCQACPPIRGHPITLQTFPPCTKTPNYHPPNDTSDSIQPFSCSRVAKRHQSA
jgi:hypothetical protein